MARFNPSDILSSYSSIAALNANFDLISAELEKCLYRDGTAPNAMSVNLDMNNFGIVNTAPAVYDSDVPNYGQLTRLVASIPRGPEGPAGTALSLNGMPVITADEFGAVADDVTDSTDAINTALASTSHPVVHLGPGIYRIRRNGLTIPNGKSLVGAGIDQTTLKIIPLPASETQTVTANAISTATGSVGVHLSDFTLDCFKSGLGRGAANRCHGIVIYGKDRTTVHRVKVKNCTGYGFWNNGTSTNRASAHLVDCHTENCEVHFEQIFAHDVVIDRAIGIPGDGDVPCESFYHQYGDCDRIVMLNSYFKGPCGVAWSPLAEFAQLRRVALINSHIESTSNTLGLSFGGAFIAGAELYIDGSVIKSQGNNAANITGGTLYTSGSKYQGVPIGMAVGAGAKVYASNCEGLGTTTDATQSTYGLFVDPGGYVAWMGGRIESSGGVNSTYAGSPLVSDQTELVPDKMVVRTDPFVQKHSTADDGTLPTGYIKTAGLELVGASDAVGNVTALLLRSDGGNQVALRSINKAGGHSAFEILVRNASDMVRAFEIGTDLSASFKGALYAPVASIPDFTDDTAAATGGVAVGRLYRTGSTLKIRVA